jgi:hypothetical protein
MKNLDSKCDEYVGMNVDIKKLIKSIEKTFVLEQFDVMLLDFNEANDQYSCHMQLSKTSKIRKIVGARKKAIVQIEGKSNSFKIGIHEEDIGRNILSSTLISLPVNVITFGTPTAIAVGANLLNKKKFKDHLLKVIYREVQQAVNTKSVESTSFL